MGKIIRLTETDLVKIIKKVLKEQNPFPFPMPDMKIPGMDVEKIKECLENNGVSLETIPQSCKNLLDKLDKFDPTKLPICIKELNNNNQKTKIESCFKLGPIQK